MCSLDSMIIYIILVIDPLKRKKANSNLLHSNLHLHIQEEELFSHFDGFPRKPFPHSWRGKNGLYAAGFTKKGLMGTSYDALRIASDIADKWTETFASPTATNRSSDYGA